MPSPALRDSRWENHDFDRAASTAVGTGAMPMDSHGLTSSRAAFATPVGFSAVVVAPSRAFTFGSLDQHMRFTRGFAPT